MLRRLDRDAANRLVLRKHHLAADSRADEAIAVVRDLVGLHATDPVSPYLQLRARMRAFESGQLEALLDEGEAAKLACMRGTLFVQAADLIPLVVAATRGVLARGRDRYLAENGLSLRRYGELAERVAEVLAGQALDARRIRAALATREALPAVLHVMCDEGRLVRWKGRGGWRAASQTYRLFAEALPDVDLSAWEESEAIRELVRRYVRSYGPVSVEDVRWWTGLDAASVREALASLGEETLSVQVEGSGGELLVHRDDDVAAPRARPTPEVSLLPILDPYLQGYKNRERVIDAAHRDYVSDGKGNTTSVVLVDGRVAGVWDLVREPEPEVRIFFLAAPPRAVREEALATAAEIGASLHGHPLPVVEVGAMRRLTERAGWVISPLTAVARPD